MLGERHPIGRSPARPRTSSTCPARTPPSARTSPTADSDDRPLRRLTTLQPSMPTQPAEIDRRLEILEIDADVQIGREGAGQLEALADSARARREMPAARSGTAAAAPCIVAAKRGLRPRFATSAAMIACKLRKSTTASARWSVRSLMSTTPLMRESKPRCGTGMRRQHRMRDGQPRQVRAADESQPIVAKAEIEVRVHLALGAFSISGEPSLLRNTESSCDSLKRSQRSVSLPSRISAVTSRSRSTAPSTRRRSCRARR